MLGLVTGLTPVYDAPNTFHKYAAVWAGARQNMGGADSPDGHTSERVQLKAAERKIVGQYPEFA